MYLGIHCTLKRNKKTEDLLNTNASTLVYGASDYYFTNPIIAFQARQFLSKNNKNYIYGIQEIPEEIINNKTHINSFEDFTDYISKSLNESDKQF